MYDCFQEDAKNNFIQLQHAYEILKDDERRKKYDDFGVFACQFTNAVQVGKAKILQNSLPRTSTTRIPSRQKT